MKKNKLSLEKFTISRLGNLHNINGGSITSLGTHSINGLIDGIDDSKSVTISDNLNKDI